MTKKSVRGILRNERFDHITNPQKTLEEVNNFLNVLQFCVASSRADSEIQLGCPTPEEIDEMRNMLEEVREYDTLREFTHGFATPNRNLFLPVNSRVIQTYLSHKDVQKGIDILRDLTHEYQMKVFKRRKDREEREMRGEEVGEERRVLMRRPTNCASKFFELMDIGVTHYKTQLGRNIESGNEKKKKGKENEKEGSVDYYTQMSQKLSQPATMKDIEQVREHMSLWEPVFDFNDPKNPVNVVISCGGLDSYNPMTGTFENTKTTIDKVFDEYFRDDDSIETIAEQDVDLFKHRFKLFMKTLTDFPINPVVEHIEGMNGIQGIMQRQFPKDVVFGEEISIRTVPSKDNEEFVD